MSLLWALISLEREVTEKYFEILEFDDNGKPKAIRGLDFGERLFINPLSIYNNEKDPASGNPSPMIFGMPQTVQESDIAELEGMGWSIPGSQPISDNESWLKY